MSIKAFDEALDFMPAANAGARKAQHGFWLAMLQALSEGRSAEAEYNRQIARGVAPGEAIEAAFKAGYKKAA